jgi:hypothetical protein
MRSISRIWSRCRTVAPFPRTMVETKARSSVMRDISLASRSEGLLASYLAPSEYARRSLRPDWIGTRFHSQLFRNIVFACEMACELPWHVVNLVSNTQPRRADEIHYSFVDRPRGALLPQPRPLALLHLPDLGTPTRCVDTRSRRPRTNKPLPPRQERAFRPAFTLGH